MATFRSDGRLGVARITAATGGSTGGTTTGGTTTGGTTTGGTTGTLTATTEVQVGEVAKTIILQPTPTTLPADGGSISLLAIVRDSRGQPLANQGVNFTTELGTLNSRGATVRTNARGEARDTLSVSQGDLANDPSAITVTAQTAGADGALVNASFEVRIQSDKPVASFEYQRGSTDLSVKFDDTSTAPSTLIYSWTFGDGSGSTQANPEHQYAAAGDYNVTLSVTDPNSGLSDTATARITVPVPVGQTGTGQ